MQIDSAVKFVIVSVKFHFGLIWLKIIEIMGIIFFNSFLKESHDKYHIASPDPKGLAALGPGVLIVIFNF